MMLMTALIVVLIPMVLIALIGGVMTNGGEVWEFFVGIGIVCFACVGGFCALTLYLHATGSLRYELKDQPDGARVWVVTTRPA